MDNTGCNIHARYSNGCSECNRQPTREQVCAELARAMGWTLMNWTWYGVNGEQQADPPNPFQSAEDSRALVAWICGQSINVQSRFGQLIADASGYGRELKGCDIQDYHIAFMMNAPLPIIAEAAWRAIQGKQ